MHDIFQLFIFRKLEKTIICKCIRYCPIKEYNLTQRKCLLFGNLHIENALLKSKLVCPYFLNCLSCNLLRIYIMPCMLDSGLVSSILEQVDRRRFTRTRPASDYIPI